MFGGQWLGRLHGYANGDCVIEVDRVLSGYQGRATFFQDGVVPKFVFAVPFCFCAAESKVIFTSQVFYEAFGDTARLPEREVVDLTDDIILPNLVEIKFHVHGDTLDVSVETKKQVNLSPPITVGNLEGKLKRFPVSEVSIVQADKEIISWKLFREHVLNARRGKRVYRGQSFPHPLRTSFHRSLRKDLYRFAVDDIPKAFSSTIVALDRRFDLNDPNDRASFWYLLQHHGFPTPLLDWSVSPFVAAFFAFSGLNAGANGSVRIFEFELEKWVSEQKFNVSTVNVLPNLSFIHPFPLSNPRAIAQQACCSLSTLDNIERFVQFCEQEKRTTYLRAYDLPYADRSQVLYELRLMGITAASLMPGLDGVCADLKEQLFPRFDDGQGVAR